MLGGIAMTKARFNSEIAGHILSSLQSAHSVQDVICCTDIESGQVIDCDSLQDYNMLLHHFRAPIQQTSRNSPDRLEVVHYYKVVCTRALWSTKPNVLQQWQRRLRCHADKVVVSTKSQSDGAACLACRVSPQCGLACFSAATHGILWLISACQGCDSLM